MKSFIQLYILFSALIIVASCAKQSSPQGGPRDEEPPVVMESIPENGSVNFSTSSFEVTFNEYVVLQNINQDLMISPPLEEKPDILVRGKTMRVRFEDEQLIDDVTYTFNFLNSIQDLNENIPLENYRYVFSTGSVIDSLSITGTILDAFTLEPDEDILVLMYSELNDTMPQTSLPRYVTKASDEGNFRIDNIAGGEYRIFGLKDANNNKIFDIPDETFAFLDSAIVVSASNNFIPPRPDSLQQQADSLAADTLKTGEEPQQPQPKITAEDSLRYERIPGKEYRLYLFVAENKSQYLTGTDRTNPYLLTFTFALPVDSGMFDISFMDIEGQEDYFTEVSAQRDTFRIWLTDSLFYLNERITAYIDYPETDSMMHLVSVRDTVQMRYTPPARSRRSESGPEALKPSVNFSARDGVRPDIIPAIWFETPVNYPDTGKIKLFLMNDTIRTEQPLKLLRDTVDNKKFNIDAVLMADSVYVLLTDSAAFSDIYGKVSDSSEYRFKVRKPDTYGKIIMNLSGFKGNMILQVLDASEEIVREKTISLSEPLKVEFQYLPKGDYMLKAISDLDNNGRWNSGDYSEHKQPEPVSYYDKKLTVKEGWDLEEDWVINSFMNKNKELKSKSGSSGR